MNSAQSGNICKSSKIFVAGHSGLVGSAITRTLRRQGFENLVLKTRQETDLRSQDQVWNLFKTERPEYVVLAAAKVGGIWANQVQCGDFILENLQIQTNVISSAFELGVRKLIFLGSSCVYPKFAEQPIREEALLTGPLEETNVAYVTAKIAGIMLCKSLMIQHKRRFISLIPSNVYGPGDRYDRDNSHVIPALIQKFHEAKIKDLMTVTAWGSGSPLREFLYCDDIGEAVLFALSKYEGAEPLNVGSGCEISIRDLALLIKNVVGFRGGIVWDTSKPDGTPRKLMNSSRITTLGWRPIVQLEEGLHLTYKDFLSRYSHKDTYDLDLPSQHHRESSPQGITADEFDRTIEDVLHSSGQPNSIPEVEL